MMQEAVEGVELTEALVLTRTRAPDLESVKKLNCWASEINNVKVVRRMPNLEVCSLSINRITSLHDFAHCHKLKELYVRTNNIQQLGDIHYLKSLPKLRSLWLSENPCANTPNYRATILKSLPNLQKLDNRAVTPDEVEAAQLEGDDIPIPEDFSSSCLITTSLDDTQSSIGSSIESRSFSRRKRDQRRQRIEAEEVARRSQEDGSCNSSRSEEDHSACEKSDDASKYDSDTGWRGVTDSDWKSEKSWKNVSDEGTLENPSIEADGDGNVQKSSPEENNTGVSIDKENVDRNETKASMKELSNNFEEIQFEENNNCNVFKDDCTNNETESSSNQNLPEAQDQKGVNTDADTERAPSNPLLDKIRLNDSLNCADSQDVIESIALDDLLIELASETETVDVKMTEDKTDDAVTASVSTGSEPTEARDAEADPIAKSEPNDCNVGTKGDDVERNVESGLDEKRNGFLNWEEHNRLRAELGVKQMERTSTKSFHSDVNRIRNSNILQAILSLVKELDKDSLDIVSSAVNSRREKL